MAMVPRNNGVLLARLMRAVLENPALALAAVGVATLGTVMRAGAALLAVAVGGRVWYLLPLVVCFFGGVGAALASLWVSADAHRRRATGQILVAVAVVNLLAAIALSGFDAQIALSIFDAMLN